MLVQVACLVGSALALAQGSAKLSAANNGLAFRLLPILPSSEERNVFYSPYSVVTALGMAYAGAAGTSRRELHDALGYASVGLDENRVASAHSQHNRLLLAPSNSTVKLANAAVVHKGLNVLPNYVQVLKQAFGAELLKADFTGREAVDAVNAWVNQKTQQKIRTLFDEPLDEDTRLVLLNAIYFKGTWRTKFDKAKTVKAAFYADEAHPTNVDTMRETMKAGYAYVRELRAHFLDLPYKGLDYSMAIVLPRRRDIESLKRNLTLVAFAGALSRLRETTVQVHLPRFKLEEKYALKNVLPKVGVRKVFDATEADLSGINGGRDLFVEDVVHKAVVEVNEEGSEAAAVTAVVVYTRTTAGPVQFHADRPFLFFIRNTRTGDILFVGQVNRVQ